MNPADDPSMYDVDPDAFTPDLRDRVATLQRRRDAAIAEWTRAEVELGRVLNEVRARQRRRTGRRNLLRLVPTGQRPAEISNDDLPATSTPGRPIALKARPHRPGGHSSTPR